ncbi:MAG: hypothetical protein J1E41_03595 [Ruminococcus sp.]|nr:hypothetical protein [Ruminococcus sp.]
MKKLTYLLMICIVVCAALFTSCSSGEKTSSVSATKSETEGQTKVESIAEINWEDALDTTISYVASDTDSDKDEIENSINYKILPSKEGNSFFVRYKVEGVSEGDLLVFRDGKKYVLENDGKEVFEKYNEFYPVDIANVSDEELLEQPDCISGGFGSDFDV